MELFSTFGGNTHKHAASRFFFMLKDSKILGSIPRSWQALYVKILQSRNSLPKIREFSRDVYLSAPRNKPKKQCLILKKTTIHSDESFKCLVNSPASLWPCRRDSFVPCGCRKERIWRPCRGSRWRWSPRDFGLEGCYIDGEMKCYEDGMHPFRKFDACKIWKSLGRCHYVRCLDLRNLPSESILQMEFFLSTMFSSNFASVFCPSSFQCPILLKDGPCTPFQKVILFGCFYWFPFRSLLI